MLEHALLRHNATVIRSVDLTRVLPFRRLSTKGLAIFDLRGPFDEIADDRFVREIEKWVTRPDEFETLGFPREIARTAKGSIEIEKLCLDLDRSP